MTRQVTRLAALSAAALAALLAAGAARANDKPAMAPPEPWVTPQPLPAADGKSDGRAVRVLLQDQQVRLTPEATSGYLELAMKIQTPEGLAAGNISLPWTPDMDTLTVHKLHVIRAGKVIDVLASGQEFVVLRRETNLESATLDGVFTANIQPAGLQLGDVIDLALTIRHVDPVLKGHAETDLTLAAPADLTSLRVQWPDTKPMRWRATDDFAKPREAKAAGAMTVSTSVADAKPVLLPRGAPLRFALSRTVEFSDFHEWSDLSRLIAPLFDKAATLPAEGAVRAEVARIAALSADPKVRAQAALTLVQDQVRYVDLALNAGRLVPADAETTWSRRFGDCKGKTALLLALLRPLGIAADAVLVNATGGGDGIDQRLPMLRLFNHVLVRARIAGRTYWFDGTRTDDRRIDEIKTPPFHWGLPLLASGAGLVRIEPPPLDAPQIETSLRMDASAGLTLPAPTHIEQRYRGDGATVMRRALDNLAGDARDAGLRQYWRERYDFVTPRVVSARYEDATGEEVLTLDGSAKMDWSDGRYETDGMAIGYAADFTREAGPHADAPFAIAYPRYDLTRETIILPNKGAGFTLDDANFDRTLGGVAYHRAGSLKAGTVTLEKSVRAVSAEISFAEATAEQEPLRALGRKALFIRPPDERSFVSDPKAPAVKPPDAFTLGHRAEAEHTAGDDVGALNDSEAALRSKPHWLELYLFRANILLRRGNRDGVAAEIKSMLSVNDDSDYAHTIAGAAYARIDRDADAQAEFARAIAIKPSVYVYLTRMNQRPVDDIAGRTADVNAALAIQPKNVEALSSAASLKDKAGDHDGAIRDLSVALTIKPADRAVLLQRGIAYARAGQPALAEQDYAAALGSNPSAAALNEQCWARATANVSLLSALADCNAALAQEPANANILDSRAFVLLRLGRTAEAIAAYDKAIAAAPAQGTSLYGRAIAEARHGDTARAEADRLAALRVEAGVARRFAGYGLNLDAGDDSARANNLFRVSNPAPEHH